MINMKIYKKENDMIEVYEMSINDEVVKLYKDSLANRIKFYDIKSSNNNKLGNTVSTVTTPKSTPLAITMPKSLPNVNFIVHNTKKPAIVVKELPITDVNVSLIASAIASSLLAYSFFFFSYE